MPSSASKTAPRRQRSQPAPGAKTPRETRPHRREGWRRPIRHVSGLPIGRSRKAMIEAVIWDFGGVLTSSPFEAFARFEKERGLPADIIRRTNASNHLENAWAHFERAEADIEA